ncbi:MAG: hypothetical protein V1735_03875 [Nanoarchaeota archaeon]
MEPLVTVLLAVTLLFFLLMLFLKITKKFIELLLTVNILLMVLVAVIGLIVYMDAMALKKRFPNDPKLLVLEDNGVVLTAVRLKGMAEAPDYSTETDISRYQQALNKQAFDDLVGDNYKVFVVSLESLLPMDNVTIGTLPLGQHDLLILLYAEDAITIFAELSLNSTNPTFVPEYAAQLTEQFGSSAEFKSRLFGVILGDAIGKDSLFIIRKFKEGKVAIRPETVVFSFLKLIPQRVVDAMV